MNKKYFDLIIPTLFLGILLMLIFQTAFILDWLDNNLGESLFKRIIDKVFVNQLPVFSWLYGTYLFIRYSELFIWNIYFPQKTETVTPKIIIDIYNIIVGIISIGIALSFFFNKDITALLTASSVFVGVLAFSLRSMIADFFYGLAITLEQPYRVGDWIEVGIGNNARVGKVQQIAWRSTLIITKQNIHVTVPHSVIAKRNFNNYTYPDDLWCSSFNITLAHEVTLQEVERVFFSAIKQVKELADIAKEPSLSIVQFLPQGIEWRVSFWVRDYPMESSIRLKIQRNILRDLNYCGIALSAGRLEILPENISGQFAPQINRRSNWARNLDLFDCLTEQETEYISGQAIKRILPKGKVLFEQGSKGSSLFLVYQGLLDVFVKDKAGVNEKVNQLCPGSFFGEMSLLTGEPRNATVIPAVESVVYEVNKAMIEPYLREHPLLLEHIEKLLVERKLQTSDFLIHLNKQDENEVFLKSPLAEMQEKIRRFFNL
ncbi:MAG: mechanosensitive ion channel family protein [Methylovulum sp.]|nr:mechanosensitive ion channel family protein [Methylovulum sp.]